VIVVTPEAVGADDESGGRSAGGRIDVSELFERAALTRKELALTFELVAQTLEHSANLAEEHALYWERKGRPTDAARERRAAARARPGARRARQLSVDFAVYGEEAAPPQPSPAREARPDERQSP
jgi:hypothetical protein